MTDTRYSTNSSSPSQSKRPSWRTGANETGRRRGFGKMISVLSAILAAGTLVAAEAQTKNDFAYWDASGNGDLTCTEARGRDEGLRLPAYRDNRNGTSVIYEWLERQRASDTDNDGIACESTSNPNGYVPGSAPPPPPPPSRECPAGSPTWMGLPVCEEGARAGYDRNAFGSAYSSLEDEIIDDLPKSEGRVYTPYTCKLFDIRADGTAATDIEHIVALAEAYDSGLAESQFRTFAGDLDNLTIADPTVNRSQKSDRDAAEWGPPQNSGWFAARVVAVKQKYALSVNLAEEDALQAMLNSDASRTVTCGEPAAEVGEPDAAELDFAHFANGGLITSDLVLLNAGSHPIRPAIYFYDQDGEPIAARSVVDLTPDMEILEDSALSVRTAMKPLGELTISTHGRGNLRVGSVTVVAAGSIGGVLRFDIPGLGVAGVGDSQPVRDAIFPVRRQEGGINTGFAIRNQGEAALLVRCHLMRAGAVLDEAVIPLAPRGQIAQFIDEAFPGTDTADFNNAGQHAPDHPRDALFNRANSKYALGRFEEAQRDYSAAGGNTRSDTSLGMANCQLMLGNFREALDCYMAGRRVDPEGAATHCGANGAELERMLASLGHNQYTVRVEGNALVVETECSGGPFRIAGNSGNVGNRWGGSGYSGASGFKVKMEGRLPGVRVS